MESVSDKIYISEDGIIASGPLTRQPGSKPYRLVLCSAPDGQFVVRKDSFPGMPDEGAPLPKSSVQHSGSYFPASKFADAVAAFADQLRAEADSYRSLYR